MDGNPAFSCARLLCTEGCMSCGQVADGAVPLGHTLSTAGTVSGFRMWSRYDNDYTPVHVYYSDGSRQVGMLC